MENKTIKELVSEMDHTINSTGLHIHNLEHVYTELSRLAEDADEKQFKGDDAFFLWDNNAALQMITDYLMHLLRESKEANQKTKSLHSELFQLAQVGQIEEAE